MLEVITLLIGIATLFYVHVGFHRSESVKLKIVDCSSCFTMNTKCPDGAAEFKIAIRNLGIPLHEMEVDLTFLMPMSGRRQQKTSLRLQTEADPKMFAKGMTAVFTLMSNYGEDAYCFIASSLEDPVRQQARIHVTSQGFDAQTFSAGTRREFCRARWNANRAAFVGWLWKVRHASAETSERLPVFPSLRQELTFFGETCREIKKEKGFEHLSPMEAMNKSREGNGGREGQFPIGLSL